MNGVLNVWNLAYPEHCTGTGGIIGKANNPTVIGCTNYGDIIANFNVGGITGLGDKGEYTNCTNNSAIRATEYGRAGGIIGAGARPWITNCTNTANITGQREPSIGGPGDSAYPVGGIIGFVSTHDQARYRYAAVIGCSNSGTITGGVRNALWSGAGSLWGRQYGIAGATPGIATSTSGLRDDGEIWEVIGRPTNVDTATTK